MKQLFPWMTLSLVLVAACDGTAGEDVVPGIVQTNPRDGGVTPDGAGPADAAIIDGKIYEAGNCPTGGGGSDCWQSLAPLPAQPRFYVGVAGARGKVFVVGGFNAGDAIAVHAFDTATSEWSTMARLPATFIMPNVAAVGPAGAERLLVLGGLENSQTIEYDFATDTWKTLAPAPVDRGRGVAAVGVHGNRVLLAGGVLRGQSANALNTGKRVSELLAYDTQTDKWEQLLPMPIATGYAMGAVVGEEFWVMGGSTDFVRTDQVLVYDLTTQLWTTRPPLPRSLSSAAVAILRGKVFLTGGIATSVGMISPDCMVLDPRSGQWSTVAPVTTARFGMGAAVVADRMYVPTGLAAGVTNPDAFAPSPALEVYIP
jgi:N-acetylneuraminic acid mutarotase